MTQKCCSNPLFALGQTQHLEANLGRFCWICTVLSSAKPFTHELNLAVASSEPCYPQDPPELEKMISLKKNSFAEFRAVGIAVIFDAELSDEISQLLHCQHQTHLRLARRVGDTAKARSRCLSTALLPMPRCQNWSSSRHPTPGASIYLNRKTVETKIVGKSCDRA